VARLKAAVITGIVTAAGFASAACVTNEVDVGAGGSLSASVQLHEEPFRSWLAEPDYNTWTNYTDGSANCMAPMITKLVWGEPGRALYFTNLCPGATTAWQVTKAGGAVLSGSFTAAPEPPRTLLSPVNGYVDLRIVANFRDLGGWRLPGSDRRTRFNVFFRSANWDDYYLKEGFKHADRRVGNPMNSTFGIRTEIDLRGPSDAANGFYITPLVGDGTIDTERYYFSQKGSFYYEPGVENAFTKSPSLPDGDASVRYFLSPWVIEFTTSAGALGEIRRTFHLLGQQKCHPVVFHCAGGRDRTGFLAFLIEALCGLHVDDLYRDHLAIVFAAKGSMYAERVDGYLRGLYSTKDSKGQERFAQYGDSLAGRVRAYLEYAGVPSEELAVVTTALTGETPDEVLARVGAHEQANRYRTLVYKTGSTVNAVYRVGDDCLYREPVLAVESHYSDYKLKKAGYAFAGWSPEVDGVRESQWTPEVPAPEMTYGVIGTNASSQVEFDCEATTEVTAGGDVRVKAGTTAHLSARDVTGGAYLGCWRDDVTGELHYGASVTVTPDHPAAYTACFGRKWIYNRETGVVSDGEWSFSTKVSSAGSRKINVRRMTTAPAHGLLNLTTPIEDDAGDSDQYSFRRFGNGEESIFGSSANTTLKTLLLPSPVEEVYKSAFRSCEGLTGVLFVPRSAILYKYAFGQCPNLTGVMFEGGRAGALTLAADGAQFKSCSNLTGTVTLPTTVRSIPSYAFYETKIGAIDLSGITNIADNAFNRCSKLTTVAGWEGVESVGAWAFEYSAVTGDANLVALKAVQYHAFAYSKLTSVRLPAVTNVGYYGFIDVPLTNVTFGTSAVTFVDESDKKKEPRFSCFRGAVDGCRFVFPGLAPILPADNAALRATGKTLFGRSEKEIFLCGSWRRDPQGWNRVLSEIGDSLDGQTVLPALPPGESVCGTFNWMYTDLLVCRGWLVDKVFPDEKNGLAVILK